MKRINNLLLQLSRNELDEIFYYISKKYAVEEIVDLEEKMKIAREHIANGYDKVKKVADSFVLSDGTVIIYIDEEIYDILKLEENND